jgi:hypothetical protein
LSKAIWEKRKDSKTWKNRNPCVLFVIHAIEGGVTLKIIGLKENSFTVETV